MRNYEIEPSGGTMTAKHLISMLAVLLLLAACVCTVSAIQLNVGNVPSVNVGETGVIPISLNAAPAKGLSGYIVAFTIADPTTAEIVGVTIPSWGVVDFTSSSFVSGSGTIKVVDVQRAIGSLNSNIDLGSVTVKGLKAGSSTNLAVSVNQMDDDNGNPVTLTGATGTISVQQAPGSIKVSSTPGGAAIYLDDQPTGLTTPTQAGTYTTIDGLIAGKTYKVTVKLATYVDGVQSVTIESGVTKTVSFTLIKSGSILVKSVPVGARIFIDNIDTGQVTKSGGTIISGVTPDVTHVVRCELDKYYPKEAVSKIVPRGGGVIVSITLDLIPGNYLEYPWDVKILPRALNIANKGFFAAIVTVPKGYKAADVIDSSVYCEGIPALKIIRLKWFPKKFIAIFSAQDLGTRIEAGDSVPMTVVGAIKNSDGLFQGTDTIKVINKKDTKKEALDDWKKMTDEKIFSQFNS